MSPSCGLKDMAEDLTVGCGRQNQLENEIADLCLKSNQLRCVSRSLQASSFAIRSVTAGACDVNIVW